jgi:transcriptional regulator with XRE-family HTH domain
MSNEVTVTGWVKLGGLIRDARASQGLSQVELAARAGVSRSWLARVEAGHRGAELEPLLRLLAALDLSLTLRQGGRADRGTTGEQRATASARREAWGLTAPAGGTVDHG